MANSIPCRLRQLNLSRNPFGELESHELAQLAVVDATSWLEHLRDESALLQFVGEKGRGKTTCLRYLVSRLDQVDYVYLPEIGSRKVVIRRPMVIDEAQRLSWFTRRHVLADRRIRAIATHEDLSHLAARQRRRVLTVQLPIRADTRFLSQLLRQRIERFRITTAPVPEITPHLIQALIDQFGDNMRLIISHLYDCIQTLDQTGPIPLPSLPHRAPVLDGQQNIP